MSARLAVLALLAAVLAGCGTTKNAATTTTASTTTTAATTTAPGATEQTAVTVFRLDAGALRAETVRVPHTTAVARAALDALGVSASVSIGAGTAKVALDSATPGQVAEIVYTLTQYASVQHVDVAGRTGLTRDDVVAFAPAILVESPADGASVGRTIEVRGSASVFEASLVVVLKVGDGPALDKQSVTATEGAPGRGTFATTLHAPSAGDYTISAYAPSAADGSAQHEQDLQVTVTP